MQICKTDKQGRVSLKRVVKNFAKYYQVEVKNNSSVLLVPVKEVSLKDYFEQVEEIKEGE
jgi:hypothetical protein